MPDSRYHDTRLILPENFISGKIGVVTVLYNSASVLEDFYTSLNAQTYKDFSVYCVDNASVDDSVARCATQGARYIILANDKNLGVAAGNNQGIRAAVADGCEYVLLLNNDVVFGEDMFQQLLDGLHHNHCSMTTPLAYYHDRPSVIWAAGGFFQPWAGYRCLHYSDGDIDTGQYVKAAQVAYTPTCCVLIRRELFASVGLMDERYFVYWDDTDFMLRAWKLGKKLYLLPQTKLWHKVSSLVGTESPFRTKYVYRNHGLYVHKHVSPLFAYFISGFYFAVFYLMAFFRKLTWEQAKTRIAHWKDGWRVERAV